MSETKRRPPLSYVIDAAIADAMRSLYTLAPARVVKWDATKGRADCQILVKNVTRGEDDGREVRSWPVVTGCPVQFIGAGGFRLTCPISDGNLQIEGQTVKATTGSLMFSHGSLDRWLSGTGGEVDPELDHAHALADAVFFPGLMPFGAPWASMPTDHMTIGADAGAQLHFHNGTIVAGDEALAQFVALADKVKSELDKISTAFTKLTSASGGAVSFLTPGDAYVASPVAGSVLKAKP